MASNTDNTAHQQARLVGNLAEATANCVDTLQRRADALQDRMDRRDEQRRRDSRLWLCLLVMNLVSLFLSVTSVCKTAAMEMRKESERGK